MGGGPWPHFHGSLKVKYVLSSQIVTLLSHRDRRLRHHRSTLPGAHDESVVLINFVITL